MHLFYNPYSIVKERSIAKIDAERNRCRPCSPLMLAACCAYCGVRHRPRGTGGADRDRTDDPLLAKQVLSQLSYSPGRLRTEVEDGSQTQPCILQSPSSLLRGMVGLGRFELPTSRLSGVRSNQLSYRPAIERVGEADSPATCRSIDCQRARRSRFLKTEQDRQTTYELVQRFLSTSGASVATSF